MSYSVLNPPALKTRAPLGNPAGNTWSYRSTDDATTIRAAGYFTNGYDLGMRAGDVVEAFDTDDELMTLHAVTNVTPNGAATVGGGLEI